MSDDVKDIIRAFLAWLSICAFVVAIFFLAIISAPANAGEKVMFTMFNPEVRIVLTQRPGIKKGTAQCVAQRVDKQFMRGEWKYIKETGMIHIEWDNGVKGDFTELPAKDFSPSEIPDSALPAKEKGGHIEGDSI